MKTETVNPRIESLIYLYDLHTQLFPNVIDGISDKDANNRLNTKANHVAWLAGSLVQQRFEVAKLLGKELKQKAHELFKDYQGIRDDVSYPSMTSLKEDWGTISDVLKNLLVNITDNKLDSVFEMPDMSMPYFEFIAFSQHREAYFIGQIGLWRRLLGYEPMKYQ